MEGRRGRHPGLYLLMWRAFRLRWQVAVLLLLLLLVAGGATAGTPPRLNEKTRAAALAAELAAARSHQLYLLLDPFAPELDLAVDGIVLRRFPVESALFGRSRLAGGDLAWPADLYTLVSQLDEPDRPKIPIQNPAPNAATGTESAVGTESAGSPGEASRPGFDPHHANPAIRPASEELLERAPTHFRLRFEPALDVSILGEAGVANLPGRLWRARHRLIEGWEALWLRLHGQTVPPRVVLTVKPEEARRLFLALLPKMRLVLKVTAAAGKR